MAWNQSISSGEIGAAAGDGQLHVRQAGEVAHDREGHGVEEVPRLLLLLGERAVAGRHHQFEGGVDAVVEGLGPRRIGRRRRQDPLLQLLPHPRHAEHDVGPHGHGEVAEPEHVVARRHRGAERAAPA